MFNAIAMKEKIDILGAAFLWGTMGIVVDLLYPLGGNPFSMVLFRSIFGLIFLLFYRDFKGLINFKLLIIGVLNGIFIEIFVVSITIAGAPFMAVMLYTSILFVIIFSFLFIKEKITKMKIISAFLIIFGLYLTYLGTVNFYFVILGLLSGLTYGLLISFSKKLQFSGIDNNMIIAAEVVWSIPLIFLVSFFVDVNYNVYSISGGLYLAIFAEIVPYYLFYRGMKKLDSSLSMMISSMEPVFTIILAFFIIHETLTEFQFIGAIIIIISITISNIKIKK